MMIRRSILRFPAPVALGIAALALAAPAGAWTGSAPAGEYRITATIATDGSDTALRSLMVSLSPSGAQPAAPMTLHAWFVDEDGMVLAPATLAAARASGSDIVAAALPMRLPARATALIVVAQPTRSLGSGNSAAAVVTRIALTDGA